MINERFFLADVSTKDSLNEEDYQKLCERFEDPRVQYDGEMYIIVKSEDKDSIAKEYNLKFQPLKYVLTGRIIDNGEIDIQLSEISEKDENIGTFIWKYVKDNKKELKRFEKEILEFVVNEMYKKSDEDLVDDFVLGNYNKYINYYLNKECYKLFIEYLQNIYNSLSSEQVNI